MCKVEGAKLESPVVANNPTVEPVVNKPVTNKVTYTPKAYKGLAEFNKAYDEVEKSNPEAKKYRQFLTKMAEQESGFNSAIQNRAGAPAYGYFQFMQDDKKYNNIRQYAGTDVETFRSNPKLQIEAAIKLAKSFEKGFSKEDLELAKKNGYSTWGLLGGAWLAGNGGVRKFLQGKGNPSDRHWSKEGKGTDVAARIKAFNFKEGGIVKYQNPAHGIARRDATYVAPKMYAPRPYKTKEEEIIEQNRNSEMISIPAHSTISMVDGKLQVIDTPARQITNIGAGYLSGTDPVGEFVVGNVVAGKPLMWLGRGLEYGAAKAGSQLAKNRIVGRAINNSEIKTPSKMIYNNSAKTIQPPITTNTERVALFNTPTTTIKRAGTSSPYREIGKAIEPKSKSRLEHISVDSPMFGDYINRGSQQVVFGNATNSNQVLKVLTNRKFTSVPEIKEFHKQWMKRNRLPLQERITFEGYLQGNGRLYPVYSQNRVSTLGNISAIEWEKIHLPKLNKEMSKLGYSGSEGVFTNGKLTVGDVSPNNVGYVNGNIRFVDADVYKKGGKLPPSW